MAGIKETLTTAASWAKGAVDTAAWAAQDFVGLNDDPFAGSRTEAIADVYGNDNPERFIEQGKKVGKATYYRWPNTDGDHRDFKLSIDDLRMAALVAEAHRVGALKDLPPEKQREGQAVVAQSIIAEMYRQFGDYNTELTRVKAEIQEQGRLPLSRENIARMGKLREEEAALGSDWGLGAQAAELRQMDRDRLVCRHQSGVFASAMAEAGIPTYVVGGTVTNGIDDNRSGRHSWVFSEGAIYETTFVNPEQQAFLEKRILNGVSLEEMRAGKPVVTVDQGGNMTVYRAGNSGLTYGQMSELATEDKALMQQYEEAAWLEAAKMKREYEARDPEVLMKEARSAPEDGLNFPDAPPPFDDDLNFPDAAPPFEEAETAPALTREERIAQINRNFGASEKQVEALQEALGKRGHDLGPYGRPARIPRPGSMTARTVSAGRVPEMPTWKNSAPWASIRPARNTIRSSRRKSSSERSNPRDNQPAWDKKRRSQRPPPV